MPASDEVVIGLAVGAESREVRVEAAHQLVGMVAHGLIGGQEVGVVVAQEGAHGREAVLEVEEDRAAANERLNVALDGRREKTVELQ